MSASLERLRTGLTEVQALLAANPKPKRGLPRFDVLRAIGRSAVVLTTSHLEAYVYGITEESVAFLGAASVNGSDLPIRLRLRHTAIPVEAAASTGWEKREQALLRLFADEGSLWLNTVQLPASLDHERLLASLKTPRAKPLNKYFADWGIADIFTEITRKPTTRAELYMRIDELGEKRNQIAHGDFTTQATPSDIRRYVEAVDKFCSRVDKVMSRRVLEICSSKPW